MLKLPSITYFDMFLRKLGYADKFTGVSGSITEDGSTVEIVPSGACSPEDFDAMLKLKDSYNWECPDYWYPKLQEFKSDCFKALPELGKITLAPVLLSTEENLEALKMFWLALVNNRPAWLTNEVVTTVDDLATFYNIELK